MKQVIFTEIIHLNTFKILFEGWSIDIWLFQYLVQKVTKILSDDFSIIN